MNIIYIKQTKLSGMENKQPLLSMCIPTYNGGDKLEICLDKLFTSIAGNMDVEVIVSDNCSTDNTQEIIEKYKANSCFRYYRNDTNIGFNGNLLLLIEKYAQGKYCWVIGDDDFLDFDAISIVLGVLTNIQPAFVSIKHRCLNIQSFKNFNNVYQRKIEIKTGDFFECVDQNASYSNILGTFMSSQLFMLDRVKCIDKSCLSQNDWSDFKTVFPNSYMMTLEFHNDENCCCIISPIFTALVAEKLWDDKLGIINREILPKYLNWCNSEFKNAVKLKKNKELIVKINISENFKLFSKNKYNDISFNNFSIFTYLGVIIKILCRKLTLFFNLNKWYEKDFIFSSVS